MVETYFEWTVSTSGYGWVEPMLVHKGDPSSRMNKPEPYLTADFNADLKNFIVRRYKPLQEHTGLFRTFAETTPDPEGIKQFADRFGPLLGPKASPIGLPHRPVPGGLLGGAGEPLSTWAAAILTMRRAVNLWDAARSGDVVMLGKHFTWRENTDLKDIFVLYDSHPDLKRGELPHPPAARELRTIVSSKRDERLFAHLTPGDVIWPTKRLVQQLVNENMESEIAPRLLWNDDQSALCVYQVPKTLLGALWLQFAGAIDRNSDFRKCSECGTWFELTPHIARSDKLFCSNACRLKAFRRRRSDAIRRYMAGESLEAIASSFNADPATIQGWIDRDRERANRGRQKKGFRSKVAS